MINRGVPDASFASTFELDEYLRQQQKRVEQACAEQALFRSQQTEARLAHREDQFHGIRSQGRGLKFSESYSYGDPDQVLCPDAWGLLRYYRGVVRVVRG